MSSQNGHTDCVRLLLESGASKETKENVCIILYSSTCMHQSTPILRVPCLDVHISLPSTHTQYQEQHGRTALVYAAGSGYTGIVRLLLEIGVDVYQENVRFTMSQELFGCVQCVCVILIVAVDVATILQTQGCALSRAAEKGHYACARMLLGVGNVSLDVRYPRMSKFAITVFL